MLESDGKLIPLEIKKTLTPGSQLARVFKVIDKSILQRRTVLSYAWLSKLGTLERDTLVVPVWLI